MLNQTSCRLTLVFLTLWFVTCTATDFKLGMLSPFKHPRLGWANNAAAATIAVDKAQSDGLVKQHNISVFWRDDKCNAPGGTEGTLLFKQDDVDVIIGPPCSGSTTPSGLLASFWNIPMFSQASSDPSLADKSVYKTLVRLGPPFNKMGKAFVELFHFYNWTQVVMITKRKNDNRNVFCDYSSRSVETAFQSNDIEIADYIQIDAGISDEDIEIILDKAKQRSRKISADRRRIMLKAHAKGMTDGSYVYIIPDHLPPDDIASPWQKGDEYDVTVKEAYNSVFQVSVAEMAGPEVEAFRDLVSDKMADHPWNYNETRLLGLRGSEYSAFLHDVVYLYLLVLNETLANNEDHRNGSLIFERVKGKTFRGMTGNVKVDSNGDREPDYWVWDLIPGEPVFQVAMEISLTTTEFQKIQQKRAVVWETYDGKPPLSIPRCGLTNELCPTPKSNSTLVASVVITIFVFITIIMSIAGHFMYRKSKFEKDLQLQLWRINSKDIKLTRSRMTGSVSQISLRSITSSKLFLDKSSETTQNQQIFSLTGYYKGTIVAIKSLDISCLTFTRGDLLELKAMREVHYENINTFLGVCVEERCPCIVMAYCQKGSLEDIIENDDIKLDWMFKLSLMTDLINGMFYLHSSALRCHGNLKSSNCLVDNRWILKITDYGISKIRNKHRKITMTTHRFHSSMFWTAPEDLRSDVHIASASQTGDVYAIGIVLFEILFRRCPYDTTMILPEEIIRRVKNETDPPFRPTSLLSESDKEDAKTPDKSASTIMHVIETCWLHVSESRPTTTDIKHELTKLHNGKKLNIVDNMVIMLEKYAVNLESIVEQRTSELVEEKQKTDILLYRMLPEVVAEDLKLGKIVEPEIFDNVTIYFSDIVGFTSLSAESTPIEIVDFLNDLYTSFDAIISRHDAYKVETIGDAYMAVSGLPVRNGDKHTEEIANMSLDLLKNATEFKIRHKPSRQLRLRIGIHSGSCAAGVVGRTMPRYCLFGDTVNMASRMESTGEAMKIHVSQNAKTFLERSNKFNIELRGVVEVKGKGSQTTYWLLGRNDL